MTNYELFEEQINEVFDDIEAGVSKYEDKGVDATLMRRLLIWKLWELKAYDILSEEEVLSLVNLVKTRENSVK